MLASATDREVREEPQDGGAAGNEGDLHVCGHRRRRGSYRGAGHGGRLLRRGGRLRLLDLLSDGHNRRGVDDILEDALKEPQELAGVSVTVVSAILREG